VGRDVTFSDPRDRNAGTAGVTGMWGTRPAPPVTKPRALQQVVFRIELTRLVGAERADEIVRTILAPDFFQRHNTMQELSPQRPGTSVETALPRHVSGR
jgi:hypothetical protein